MKTLEDGSNAATYKELFVPVEIMLDSRYFFRRYILFPLAAG